MNTRNTRLDLSSEVINTNIPPQLQSVGEGSNQILYISTGISVLVVLTVAAVVGISLIICLRRKKRVRHESRSEKDTSKIDMDDHMYDNPDSIRANSYNDTLNQDYDYVDYASVK